MTGEMHASEVTREAYPLHFAIADRLGGEVRPFDQYQGPFVAVPDYGRFWVSSDDGCVAFIFAESYDTTSPDFPADLPESPTLAADAAGALITGPEA